MMPWSIGELELDLHRFKRDVINLSKRMKNVTSKWCNLDSTRKSGLKKLQERIRKKEIVCFSTDKSGRWSCDTPENYKNACMAQLADDDKTPTISIEEHNESEKIMNAEARSLLMMLGVDDDKNGERLRKVVSAKGVKIPPFYGTRKDHKTVPAAMKEIGPKVRPVCGAEDCVTRRLSYILCLIGSHLIDSPTHCDSTVDLLEEIENVNKSGRVKDHMIIGSLDVDALYPSLDVEKCSEVFRQKLFSSELRFEGMEWKDIALYLKYHMSEIDLRTEGVWKHCPRRRRKGGNEPSFTASGVDKDKKKRFGPWIFPRRKPGNVTLRKMFCLAIKCMIKVTMKNHDFQFDGTIYRQSSGGSIGLDLTGVLSDVYMCHWDKILIERCEAIGLLIMLYKRYKDDVNVLIDPVETVIENSTDDKLIMAKMKEIADGIDPCLKVSTDYCSNHSDMKTPILDLKVWIGKNKHNTTLILHSHYMKEVSSRMVMHENSSHSMRMKFNVLVNEFDRIVRNCTPHLDWNDTVVPHLSYFVKRMVFSGYSHQFCFDTLNKALQKYDIRKEQFDNGESYYNIGIPTDHKKSNDWYRGDNNEFDSVMFVEASPDSHYKSEVEKLVKKNKLKIKVIERAGQTVKQLLQRSDPFQARICGQKDCFVCENNLPINCRERGVVYELKCKLCQRKYDGQTHRNACLRFGEHMKDWYNGNRKSPLVKHQELYHPNENFEVDARVLYKCFGKPTRRLITESVLIGELSNEETMNNKREWTYTQLDKI